MSHPKKAKFGGFSTASEFMNDMNMVGDAMDDHRRVDGRSVETNAAMVARGGGDDAVTNPRGGSDTVGGFSTAKEFMENNTNTNNSGMVGQLKDDRNYSGHGKSILTKTRNYGYGQSILTKTEENALQLDTNSLRIHLTVRGIKYHKENLQALDSITLHREPTNEYDTNAIGVNNGEGNLVGHIAKEQACILAKPMDANIIGLSNVSLKEQKDATLLISVQINLIDEGKMDQFLTVIVPKMISIQTKPTEYPKLDIITDEDVTQLAKGITAQDAKTASTCPFDIIQMNSLPWKKNADGSEATWPPNQDFLDELGYGSVDDEKWWQDNTGLKPPSTWNVTGALDLLPNIPISAHQKSRAANVLDDAIHGVTNVWSDATLDEVRDLMLSENFWSFRSSDAFIKAYGGPYILGQQEGKLKLIRGAPHLSLTAKICRGHNVVYELVHATKPPEPGFNTLIFGLNLRRSGFHYHQDTIASLKAKNAPLVGKQPVVTTVYYEKPDEDNGKELVLWKPMLNFKPREDSLYMAARGVQTTHGMVHVQKAGLQSHAQHGIFHTPIFEEGSRSKPVADARKGYRVAITARITFPDSDKSIQPYLEGGHYCKVLGPEGNKTLRLSPV